MNKLKDSTMKPLLLLKKEECKEISDNDFYLVNDTTIRKEYKGITDPEYIILMDVGQSYIGLFKHVNGEKMEDAEKESACWYKLCDDADKTK